MAEQQVYKTDVTCSIGFSICSPDGSWEKSSVSISSEVGPGYPTPEYMSYVLTQQMDDAVKACNKQIGEIANKIVEETRRKIG